MKVDVAVDLARRFAAQESYDPAAYDTRPVRNSAGWVIYFRPKTSKPRPGDFFAIYINSRSGAVERLVPGK